jgi:hypothetical protein
MAFNFKGVGLPRLVNSTTPNQSSRGGASVRLIVPHTAEGSYAGTVSWLKSPQSNASSHLVLNEDGSEVTQLVGYDRKAWTQSAFNPYCESIECAGYLNPAPKRAGHGKGQEKSLARIIAFRLRKRGLPPRWVQNRNRWSGRGYTRHGDLVPEGGHPNCLIYSGWRWRVFRARVRFEYYRGGFREFWGRD